MGKLPLYSKMAQLQLGAQWAHHFADMFSLPVAHNTCKLRKDHNNKNDTFLISQPADEKIFVRLR